ncbi:MAG TPA: HAD family hydrolase [Thermoplasmata archaeon]|nr:HAD family hydrolase [Thermoplasmata archaeon]
MFDVDDTLYDHAHAVRAALEHLRKNEPLLAQHPLPKVARQYADLLEEVHPKVVKGSVAPDDARSRRLQALYAWAGRKVTLPEARKLAEEYRNEYLRNQRAVPGSNELVRWLAGRVRLGVVSNNRTDEQVEKLRTIGMDGLFAAVVTSEEVGAAKPDSDIFEAALRKLGVDAGNVLMVGDSWDADVLGARGCEIPAVWYNAVGLPIPDPALAVELRSYTPLDRAVGAIAAAFELERDT